MIIGGGNRFKHKMGSKVNTPHISMYTKILSETSMHTKTLSGDLDAH
jgi:hypothetical protein